MRSQILAAAFVLAATSASLAQAGFNPGTVVGNVYANPAAGCGYGYGYVGPGCGYYLSAPAYRYTHHKRPGRAAWK
jgi:hypothetical protein